MRLSPSACLTDATRYSPWVEAAHGRCRYTRLALLHPPSSRVKVYCPWTLQIEISEATDPYSVSLAADGDRTQVCEHG